MIRAHRRTIECVQHKSEQMSFFLKVAVLFLVALSGSKTQVAAAGFKALSIEKNNLNTFETASRLIDAGYKTHTFSPVVDVLIIPRDPDFESCDYKTALDNINDLYIKTNDFFVNTLVVRMMSKPSQYMEGYQKLKDQHTWQENFFRTFFKSAEPEDDQLGCLSRVVFNTHLVPEDQYGEPYEKVKDDGTVENVTDLIRPNPGFYKEVIHNITAADFHPDTYYRDMVELAFKFKGESLSSLAGDAIQTYNMNSWRTGKLSTILIVDDDLKQKYIQTPNSLTKDQKAAASKQTLLTEAYTILSNMNISDGINFAIANGNGSKLNETSDDVKLALSGLVTLTTGVDRKISIAFLCPVLCFVFCVLCYVV